MGDSITRKKVISSLFWKLMERGGVQGIQFVISIILARLLTPDDYGIIALILVFIQIANVFIQTGFSTSLIQKTDSDDLDFSSVFYLGLFIALLLNVILFFLAPFIANFYKLPILTTIVRVLSITLFFGSFNSVQNAYVSKNMQFKNFFFSSMGAVLGSGIIGIICAYCGFGVWSLVIQQIVAGLLTTLILWFTVKWRPKFIFSFERVKKLFSFGWKLLSSALLETVFSNVYSLVIGKVYTSNQLGVFNRGQQFPQIIASNLDGSIQSVMLPTLSSKKDDKIEVKRVMRRSVSMSCYLLMPCMFGLAAVGKPLVNLLLTEKWESCVIFLQLACLSYSVWPIHTANLTAINALGRSDVFLKLEIIKKIISVLILVITIPFGITVMAIGQVVSGFICTFVNASPNKNLLNYSYIEQVKDLLPSFLASFVMGICVWSLNYLKINNALLLGLQIFCGMSIYLSISSVFELESFTYLVNVLKDYSKKKRVVNE